MPYINNLDVAVVFNETYQLVQQAKAALVASGTATLETALLNCPQVVCYKITGGDITWFIAKNFIIKVPYISLVNLVLNKPTLRELVGSECRSSKIKAELDVLLQDSPQRIRNNFV